MTKSFLTKSFFSSAPRSLVALTLLVGGGLTSAQAARFGSGPSPDGLWQLHDAAPAARADREVYIAAKRAQTFTADMGLLRSVLSRAPFDEATAASLGAKSLVVPVEISLPMPRKGKFERFSVSEVRIMEPGLAALHPDIKTYRGVGIDDPAASVALDVTPAGFHAQIMSPAGWVYISPYYFAGADNLYASYRKQDALDGDESWVCETVNKKGKLLENRDKVAPDPDTAISGTLRTYRLAIAANSFYVAANGGTKASALAAIVTVMNRVSAIYESEVAIRLLLIANEDPIIYPDAATDPFVSNGTAVINNSTAVISAAVGEANYDIGHVFTTGSGGISGLGVVCSATKGRSTTGLPTPYGDAYNVDYVAHEMGHQFGGNHTFNGNTSNCGGGNRSATHAYEPGSGNTIMAYAGICGATSDLQPHSDAYFHSESIMEILTFAAGATGGSCPVSTANTNSAPLVSAGLTYVIPISTPFTLTGNAVDPDNDPVTYCWEERDRGAAQAGTAADNGASPIFRSFNPVYSPSRTFPKISDLLNNTTTIGEQLPTLARTLNFRLTVRDNKANGGATNSADVAITVSAAAGPFLVTAPNAAITVASGGPLAVTWNVANTSVAPVNTATVNVLLSLDGGYTYPVTLAANTANDGSEIVTLPAGVRTSAARIRVEATNSIYFDISNANFTIN